MMPYSYEPHAFEDFDLGQTFVSPGRTITESDVVMQSMLSGDWTEFHTNVAYARESPFGERIAHGPLTFSIAIGLMFRCGFLERTSGGLASMDEVKFVNPLSIGETVHVDLEVMDRHDISREDIGMIDMAMAVVTEDDTTIFECVLTLMIRRRSELDWD